MTSITTPKKDSKFIDTMDELLEIIEDTKDDIKRLNQSLLIEYALFEQLCQNIEKEKKVMSRVSSNSKEDLLELNYGGKIFTTFRQTLTKVKNSKMASLFEKNSSFLTIKDKNGRIVIDRPSQEFSIILKSLRSGRSLQVPEDEDERKNLISEIEFYGLKSHFEKELKRGLFIGTSLLNESEMDVLNKWIGSKKDWHLCYKATVDSFSTYTFRNMASNKGPTVTVIKSSSGNIFGGYSNLPWSSVGSYQYDPKCFLFSLVTSKGRTPIQILNTGPHAGTSYSVYQSSSYGPTFGGGHDLYICHNSNSTNSSYTNLGHSYSLSGYTYGQQNTKDFLAGSYNFMTVEIECFYQK